MVYISQALEVIRQLQKNFPIKRSPMRLRLIVPGQNFLSLCEKLNEWGATVVSKDESGTQLSVVSELYTLFPQGEAFDSWFSHFINFLLTMVISSLHF